jgi:hypothetical protein
MVHEERHDDGATNDRGTLAEGDQADHPARGRAPLPLRVAGEEAADGRKEFRIGRIVRSLRIANCIQN